jgi:hypothetical protein
MRRSERSEECGRARIGVVLAPVSDSFPSKINCGERDPKRIRPSYVTEPKARQMGKAHAAFGSVNYNKIISS